MMAMKDERRYSVFIRAWIPADLDAAFFQHLRNFDVAHPNCNFEVMVDAPNLTMKQMIEKLQVDPKLTFTKIMKRELDIDD